MDGEMAAYAGLGQFVITVTGTHHAFEQSNPLAQNSSKRNAHVKICLPRNHPQARSKVILRRIFRGLVRTELGYWLVTCPVHLDTAGALYAKCICKCP